MHLLITGSTGLVGRFIVDRFLAEGWQVTNLSRARSPGLAHIPFALGDKADLPVADLLAHCAFDHIPGHYRGGEGDDPEGFRTRNLNGSIALFEASKAAGIANVAFLSSRAVYGDYLPGTSLHEDLPPRPDTLYGQVKLEAENALAELSDANFTGISLRATGVYGSGNANKWSGLFADFRFGMTPPPRVATEVHGDDLADAVWRLRQGPAGVFNVSDITLDRHDLLDMVAKHTGCKTPLPPRADASKVSAMDTTKLRATGWEPGGMEKLRASLRTMIC